MEWTGSIRWIHNPVQSRRIWIGLDQKFTNLADSGVGLDREMCNVYPIFRDLMQFFLIVTLMEWIVLPIQIKQTIWDPGSALTCRFYKRIWHIPTAFVSGSWTGLD